MLQTEDTICAPATPYGRGGVSMIRISGPDALEITSRCWRGRQNPRNMKANTLSYGTFIDKNADTLDQGVISVFRTPHSFTGEDTVEISLHGSPWIIKRAMESLVAAGARVAGKGEFTKRAFINGNIDLAQAESIADMIAVSSAAGQRMAMQQLSGHYSAKINRLREALIDFASMLELELDFSEEDVEFADRGKLLSLARECKTHIDKLCESYKAGKIYKEGICTVIAGKPNAGKSTLLNTLLQEEKAIVTDIPGTTRDAIETEHELNGLLYRFFDTAGLRETHDIVEKLGVDRTKTLLKGADIILWVVDASDKQCQSIDALEEELSALEDDIQSVQLIIVINKIDMLSDSELLQVRSRYGESGYQIAGISAKQGFGMEELENKLEVASSRLIADSNDVTVTNLRHYELLKEASMHLSRAIEGIASGITADFIAQDVRSALEPMSAITGSISSTDLLTNIFSKFCIGK